ncbi:phage tail assembly protein [Rhizobium mayense]|uniref:Phage tail assembly protein n=1 Tax=Rhizobium mayense TaxID=1312184 RepID=A0ABT7JY32_9HYPH|nr:phage tail assembly protein [Rhizobium mayense]MDL2401250.1 phage tail assembly protein [Rhizobium mayense]
MKTPAPARNVTIDLSSEDVTEIHDGIIDEDAPVAAKIKDPTIIDEDEDPRDALPDDAIKNRDGSVTIPLHYPVKLRTRKDGVVAEKDYSELTLHRLTGKDQKVIAGSRDGDTIVVAFARATRINQAVMNGIFDNMDAADIARCGQVLNHFLYSGRKTGA